MREDFLRKFIEEEKYMQNKPLKTKEFIQFCKERGIETNEEELEFFEKEELLYPILRSENPIEESEVSKFFKDRDEPFRIYPQFNGGEYYKNILLKFMRDGILFDPSTKLFKDRSNDDEELKNVDGKISSFYSSFQIYWLELLKKDFTIQINFAGKKIKISSNSHCIRANSGNFSINNLDEFNDKYKEMMDDEIFNHYFNFKNKKKCLKSQYKNFELVLEFLLSMQSIYAPYGRSSSKTISVRDENWHEKRNRFNQKRLLDDLGFTIQEIVNIYWNFSRKTEEIFGIKRDDWIQLWKSIAWNEKDKLEGRTRLGVEYLQWALMLKRFIEDYCGREILDIDEISNISPNDILKNQYDPSQMDGQGRLLRQIRIRRYSDPEKNKNYYHDIYRRLFYLANDFELNYQPKIMVFVEGETEEELFPKIFEWYYGNKPENIGIEIMNFRGVDKLLSTSENAEELKRLIDNIQRDLREKCISKNKRRKMTDLIKKLEDTDIVISNWTSFIRYNLERWQIIPFFVSDDEGNVRHFLDDGKPINFQGKSYNIPNEWKYLWGESNENKPYKGNNFELANFSDKEIVSAINQVLDDEIDINRVKKTREQGEGIKKIDDRLNRKKNERGSKNKREVVGVLFDNLFKRYDNTWDESLLERPIFKLVEKIVELAHRNPPPVSTEIELINKKYIFDLLEGKLENTK